MRRRRRDGRGRVSAGESRLVVGAADPIRKSVRRSGGRCAAAALLLGVCCAAPAERADPAPRRTADEFGAEFVRLALALAEHDPLFLDYRFPGAPEAPSPLPPLAEIEIRAERLAAAAERAPRGGEESRLRYIAASTEALRTRARSLLGERLAPAEELRRIFGLRWTEPAFDLDRLRFRVERSLPGLAPLRVRASRHYRAGEVPPDAAREVLREALSACRAGSAPFAAGPGAPEPLEVEWLTAEAAAAATGSTPFYRYRGGGRGVLRLPGARPLRAAELRRLACHEGTPGHHLQAAVADAHFRETGWPELGIVPLYGPRTAVFEGLAAFAETLAPSSPEDRALRSLEPVVLSILHDYLDGTRTRLEALRALDFDALVPDPHALLGHADRFGVYAIARPAADPRFEEALGAVFDRSSAGSESSEALRRAIREGLTRDDLIELALRRDSP